MSLHHYIYIYRGTGMNPNINRATITTPDFTFEAVGLSDLKDVIPVAKQAVTNGVQVIELCGAFGAKWAAKVAEAIENKVPVGHVSYSLTDINPLHTLLSTNF